MNGNIVAVLISAGASIIVGLLTFAGVVVTNRRANAEMIHKMEVQQAVTDNKIDELTREVREHNNFAKRMPVVENEIKHANDEIKHLRAYHEKE